MYAAVDFLNPYASSVKATQKSKTKLPNLSKNAYSKCRRMSHPRLATGDRPVDGTSHEITKQLPSTETEGHNTASRAGF